MIEVKSNSLWGDAWNRLIKDKLAIFAIFIVLFYLVLSLLTTSGLICSTWDQEVGGAYMPPSSEHWFGTDIFGRSVFSKVIKGVEVAMSVGLIVGSIAIFIGVLLGSLAGFFGGKVDEFIIWLCSTLSSIPSIMLLIAITFILGKGLMSVYLALGLTSWVTLCRLVRGEVIRHKHREYVMAASSIGAGNLYRLFRHILPNVMHVVIVQFSLLFQVAIKSEVILSYLGLGVQDRPSWGTMIDDAKLELARGVWWQLAGATFAMFLIVLAFNILGDALRDSLDPKLKGKS